MVKVPDIKKKSVANALGERQRGGEKGRVSPLIPVNGEQKHWVPLNPQYAQTKLQKQHRSSSPKGADAKGGGVHDVRQASKEPGELMASVVTVGD